jgi:hypothetical protein
MKIGRWQSALGALCVAVVFAGCGSRDGGPTSSCQDVRIPTGIFLAFGWDEGEHPFGQAEPLLVCVGGTGSVRVSLAADPGVTVTPGELRNHGQNLPLRFEVTVQPGTTGGITYTQTSVDSGVVMHAGLFLNVTPSGSGWRFLNPDPRPDQPKNRSHSKPATRLDPSSSR